MLKCGPGWAFTLEPLWPLTFHLPPCRAAVHFTVCTGKIMTALVIAAWASSIHTALVFSDSWFERIPKDQCTTKVLKHTCVQNTFLLSQNIFLLFTFSSRQKIQFFQRKKSGVLYYLFVLNPLESSVEVNECKVSRLGNNEMTLTVSWTRDLPLLPHALINLSYHPKQQR